LNFWHFYEEQRIIALPKELSAITIEIIGIFPRQKESIIISLITLINLKSYSEQQPRYVQNYMKYLRPATRFTAILSAADGKFR